MFRADPIVAKLARLEVSQRDRTSGRGVEALPFVWVDDIRHCPMIAYHVRRKGADGARTLMCRSGGSHGASLCILPVCRVRETSGCLSLSLIRRAGRTMSCGTSAGLPVGGVGRCHCCKSGHMEGADRYRDAKQAGRT